ncbi:MAG: hypothetical protein ACE5EW_06640 [Thermoplasmata archaeon]
MEEVTAEEMMRHAPDASREMASHLRVGVLSLPGVEEVSYGDPSEGAYFVAFSIDGDPVLQAHMEDPLRVTLEVQETEARALLGRPDLARTEFLQVGKEERQPLMALVELAMQEAVGAVSIDFVVASQEDLRAAVLLAHAKYDALMTG